METSKTRLLNDRSVTNQQALVNRLIDETIKTKRIYIPGGVRLTEALSSDDLETSVYTWLRGCRYFEEVSISLCEDPNARKLNTKKVQQFDTTQPYPIWVMHDNRKRYLAEVFAKYMRENKFIVLTAKKDGIYLSTTDESFSPEAEDWAPYIEFLPKYYDKYR